MIEKIKQVGNPLTIIAIFAALAEVAGTVALSTVDKDLQSIFIWFVMLFPVFLVALFFATLNFNNRVLYSPSDYKNEDNFVNALKSTNVVAKELSSITDQIIKINDEFVSKLLDQQASVTDSMKSAIVAKIKSELKDVSARAVSTRSQVAKITEITSDIRTWPHEKPCPKCDGVMHLNHDTADYICRKCDYWE